MKRRPESLGPLVGGESARLIADLIRSFLVSRSPSGFIQLDDSSRGFDRVAFDRAYERVELEVMSDMAHCGHPGEHRTLASSEFRWLVLSEMMRQAKIALGEQSRLDALWTL